jgi:hypothetical protein
MTHQSYEFNASWYGLQFILKQKWEFINLIFCFRQLGRLAINQPDRKVQLIKFSSDVDMLRDNGTHHRCEADFKKYKALVDEGKKFAMDTSVPPISESCR